MRKLLASIIFLTMLITASLYFLTATSYGLQLVAKSLPCFFPGKLIIHRAEGSIFSGFTIQGLSYQSSEMKISLDNINVSWSPNKLFFHKLYIEKLAITNLHISFSEKKPEENTSYSPNLDFFRWLKLIDLQEASLNNILISKNNKTVVDIDTFKIVSLSNDNHFITVGSRQGNIQGHYRFDNNAWGMKLDFTKINLKPYVKTMETDVNFSLVSEGKWGPANKTFFMNVNRLRGKAAGHFVEGGVSFSYDNGEMILKNSRLTLGKALAQISGKMGKKYDLSWYVTVPDIAEITKMGKGRLFSKGTIIGTNKKSEVTGILEAEKISFDDIKLDIPNAKIRSKIISQSIDSDFLIQNLNFSNNAVPALNLKNIQLQTNYTLSQPLIFSGSFILGSGKGKISGLLHLEKKGLPLDLNVEGNHLLMTDLPEYKIIASPALLISYTPAGMDIKGKLLIDSAVIKPNDVSEMTTLPEETIIVGRTKSSDKTPYNLSMQVQLMLGEKFLVSYADLQTKLKGQLLVSKKFGSPIIGSGILYTVKGRYRAYGRLLHIKKGRLIYTGSPLANPGLDIQASKTFDVVSFAKDQSQFAAEHETASIYQGREKITAGIAVKGTFKKPLVSFFSDPKGMAQNDILSYLLFGCSQSQIKNVGSLAILNNISYGIHAEKHLGSANIGKITKKIKKTLGLNDISMTSVETFDPENNKLKMNTAVSIGKKFGKYISVQYKAGVFNSLSILNLKYQINKLFAIQSETSSRENGVDLLFEYEQD